MVVSTTKVRDELGCWWRKQPYGAGQAQHLRLFLSLDLGSKKCQEARGRALPSPAQEQEAGGCDRKGRGKVV